MCKNERPRLVDAGRVTMALGTQPYQKQYQSKVVVEKKVAANKFILNTFIAGGVSTCCAKTTTAPLERLKLLFQAQNRHYKNMGVLRGLKTIYYKEGALGYYRGNGAMMVRVFPYGAVQFMSYEKFNQLLNGVCENCSLNKLIAGSLAGIAACACTYPLDVVRSRLAFQVADEQTYCGICHAVKMIFTNEGGYAALYKGFTPTCMAMIPAVGLGFLTFETLKAYLVNSHSFLTKRVAESGEITLTGFGGLVCGAVAGATSQTIAYPLDVVRRNMQLAGAVPNGHKYSGVVSTLVTVYTENGVKGGLYRGLSINYLRVVPQIAVMFAVYELTKQVLNKKSTS